MRHIHWILAAALVLGACGDDDDSSATPEGDDEVAQPEAPRPLRELVGETFEPLPAELEVDMDKVLLGRALYHDNRLSGDETLSCATCHMMSHGGAEPRRVSTGIRGQQGPINSPTVLNAEYNFRQFWDGRAADLLEQAAGPVTNPVEMGGDWDTILTRLRGDEETVAQFAAVFGEEDPVTQDNILAAIVEYERSLVTPSDFDRWLRGDDDALDEQEQRGLRLFVETGCTTCHEGRNLGGTSYQRLGLVHNYFERRGGELTEADRGRFNVSHADEDLHQFKVPTLRNIELTGPYFHDGSEADLSGAVQTMAYVQLGRELTDAQTADLVAFLRSLTGELPAHAALPAPGADTDDSEDDDDDDSAAPAPAAPTDATREG